MSTIQSKVAKDLQSSGPVAWLLFIFFTLLILVNAAYTTAFGSTYMGQVLKSSILGGGMTVLFLDFAALCWFLARRYHAGNKQQLQITKTLAIATLLGSCVLTLVQIGMNVGTEAATATAETSDAEWWVGFAGLVVTTLFAIGNIIGAFAYAHFDPKELEKEKQRQELVAEQEAKELEAEELAAEKAADAARTKAIQKRAKEQRQRLMDDAMKEAEAAAAEEIYQNKPVMVAALVQQATTDYYRAVGMDDVIQRAKAKPAPTPLSASDIKAIIREELKAERKGQKRKKKGAAAGAKKGKGAKAATPAPDPTPTLARTAGECDCGLPLGTAADECPGGDACVIDANATTDLAADQLQRVANEHLEKHGNLDDFDDVVWNMDIEPGNGLTRAEIRESIKQMRENLIKEPLDLTARK